MLHIFTKWKICQTKIQHNIKRWIIPKIRGQNETLTNIFYIILTESGTRSNFMKFGQNCNFKEMLTMHEFVLESAKCTYFIIN